MTKSEKAKIIIRILNDRVDGANAERVRRYAKNAAEKAGLEAWERETRNDGMSMGFGRPPYDAEQASQRLDEASNNYIEWVEMRDFVNDTFLDMIEDEKKT
jgi:hypothetical protein